MNKLNRKLTVAERDRLVDLAASGPMTEKPEVDKALLHFGLIHHYELPGTVDCHGSAIYDDSGNFKLPVEGPQFAWDVDKLTLREDEKLVAHFPCRTRRGEAVCYVVLIAVAKSEERTEWVTAMYNTENRSRFSGNYFGEDLDDAKRDFLNRCRMEVR